MLQHFPERQIQTEKPKHADLNQLTYLYLVFYKNLILAP